ncbi:MAG TPA: site-2 protease family protein [Acidimicrobiia bacterium]
MLRGNAWRIGRVAGIEIKIDPSWAFIALLVGYTFYLIIAAQFTALATGSAVLLATAMALVFFGSVLLHELAHSLMARGRGVEVKGITLFLFGGATEADLETKEPTDEMIIAAVGPLTSLVIAAVLWGINLLVGDTAVGYAIGYLGWLNLALALFNLVPGFPLDGGRLLRSLVWRSTGDLLRATRVAARAGRIVGFLIIALGVFEIFFFGALIGGLWLVAIGWFLGQAALASFTHLQMRLVLEDVPASRLMTRDPSSIPGETRVDQAVDDYFMRHSYNAFPVTENGEVVGVLTMNGIRSLPTGERSQTSVREIMEPLSEMCVVGPNDPVGDVVSKLMQGEVGRVVVRDDGDVVGLITPRDLVRWLERSRELGLVENSMSLTR